MRLGTVVEDFVKTRLYVGTSDGSTHDFGTLPRLKGVETEIGEFEPQFPAAGVTQQPGDIAALRVGILFLEEPVERVAGCRQYEQQHDGAGHGSEFSWHGGRNLFVGDIFGRYPEYVVAVVAGAVFVRPLRTVEELSVGSEIVVLVPLPEGGAVRSGRNRERAVFGVQFESSPGLGFVSGGRTVVPRSRYSPGSTVNGVLSLKVK